MAFCIYRSNIAAFIDNNPDDLPEILSIKRNQINQINFEEPGQDDPTVNPTINPPTVNPPGQPTSQPTSAHEPPDKLSSDKPKPLRAKHAHTSIFNPVKVVQLNEVPKQLKGVDVSRVARLHQMPNPLFEEPPLPPDDIGCIEVSSQVAQEASIVWCRSEESVIQSRQIKPIGWMKKQKTAGNLSSEQFQALNHLRNKEQISPNKSGASNAGAGVKRETGAKTFKDVSDNIPAVPSPDRLQAVSVKGHSSKDNKSRIADDKQDTMARIKRTRQARRVKEEGKPKSTKSTIVDI